MAQEAAIPAEFALLVQCLSTIPDPGHACGRVHPLVGVLSLAVLAAAGACSLSDIHRLGRTHPEVLPPVGLRRSPAVATLGRRLRQVSVPAVRVALATCARLLSQQRQGPGGLRVVAADGKTLRGAWEDGQQAHIRHLLAHQAAFALDQVAAVAPPTGEVAAARAWVARVAEHCPGLAS
ncbi:MAG: hypothetical protein HY689_03750 [Chloroflexi bacterium]|nr:hypothetical protein [Chloroflexota bacterium]